MKNVVANNKKTTNTQRAHQIIFHIYSIFVYFRVLSFPEKFYHLFLLFIYSFFVLLRVKKRKADSIKMFSIPIEAVVKREDKKNDNCN